MGFEVTLLSVPHVGEQGVTPSYSVQVTPVFEVLLTVAANDCVCPAWTVCVPGLTDTATAGTVMVTEADFVLSLAEIAVRVTTRSLAGGVVGAVYVVAVPLAVDPGETVPHVGEQLVPPCVNVQLTPPLAGSFETVAVTCTEEP